MSLYSEVEITCSNVIRDAVEENIIVKVIMTHDYWICGALISTELSLWSHLHVFGYMHEKQIHM